ncbi:MAG: hypothetical protein IJL92_02300 [Thermoguttaceae bacterium]|nr:hypothetical protein [Thermoguttaceae bacterium]
MMEDYEALTEILKSDRRFSIETYRFMEEALRYANELGMAAGSDSEELPDGVRERYARNAGHVTGQDLCYAAAEYAVREYGLMARQVLSQLGIRKTGDLGDVVYNMIRYGFIFQSDDDTREDFDNVFDLGAELDRLFQFQYKIDSHKNAR